MKNKVIDVILTHPLTLLKRDFILDALTPCERTIIDPDKFEDVPAALKYIGKIFQHAKTGQLCMLADVATGMFTILAESAEPYQEASILEIDDPIKLTKGIIANYNENKPLETTVGRFIVNTLLIAMPFGGEIPYQDRVITGGDIEKIIYDLALNKKITMSQIDHYSTNAYYIGNISELGVPVYTPKSLTTSPEVLKRRNELLEQHKEALEGGDSKVMARIEAELIQMDREYLADDPANLFLSDKSFNVQRKKLHIAGGMTPRFGEPGFDWVGSSLNEGSSQKNYAIFANETRDGSYSRAMETALGGEESKHVTRVFQEARITEDDCKSTKYISVLLKEHSYKSYEGRNGILNGKLVSYTLDMLKSRVGQVVQFRSPHFCKSKTGFCFTCFGGKIEKTQQNVLTMSVNAIPAFFVTTSLKKSHGTKANLGRITNIDDFISKVI